MNNLAIILKRKRDEEARLARTSPQAVFNDNGTTQSIGVLPHTHSEYAVLSGASAPTTSTAGAVGQFYLETTTPALYQCTDTTTDYTWTEVGGGGSYELQQATETTLGGIVAAEKTTETAEVKIDTATGKLYVPAAGEAENGLPAGGAAGQILSKIDGTDYNAAWIDAPSGGTYYENSIDEPPASPSAWDDEFDDASLNVKWTRLKSSFGTITEQGNRLLISGTGGSGDNGTGILQAIPSGDFSLTASLKSILSYGGSTSASGTGLILATDTSDATSFIRFTVNIEGSMVLSTQRWNNLTSWAADLYKTTLHYDRRAYLRIRRVSTTYYFDVSFTGDSWLTVYSSSSIVITPAYIGLLGTTKVSNFSSVFDWFRVTQ